jgi:hypothetical protein
MLVSKPLKFNARQTSITDEDKGGAKRPNEIWSSRSGELIPNWLIAGTRRLTSKAEKKPETLIPPSQPHLIPRALLGSKLPILDGYMYNGHPNPHFPSSPAPIQPPEWKRN